MSPALAGGFFITRATWEAQFKYTMKKITTQNNLCVCDLPPPTKILIDICIYAAKLLIYAYCIYVDQTWKVN